MLLFWARFPWYSGNYRVWIHSEARTWHDNNIQSFFLIFIHISNWFNLRFVCFPLYTPLLFSRHLPSNQILKEQYHLFRIIFLNCFSSDIWKDFRRGKHLTNFDGFSKFSSCDIEAWNDALLPHCPFLLVSINRNIKSSKVIFLKNFKISS